MTMKRRCRDISCRGTHLFLGPRICCHRLRVPLLATCHTLSEGRQTLPRFPWIHRCPLCAYCAWQHRQETGILGFLVPSDSDFVFWCPSVLSKNMRWRGSGVIAALCMLSFVSAPLPQRSKEDLQRLCGKPRVSDAIPHTVAFSGFWDLAVVLALQKWWFIHVTWHVILWFVSGFR